MNDQARAAVPSQSSNMARSVPSSRWRTGPCCSGNIQKNMFYFHSGKSPLNLAPDFPVPGSLQAPSGRLKRPFSAQIPIIHRMLNGPGASDAQGGSKLVPGRHMVLMSSCAGHLILLPSASLGALKTLILRGFRSLPGFPALFRRLCRLWCQRTVAVA